MFNRNIIALNFLHLKRLFLQYHLLRGSIIASHQLKHLAVEMPHNKLNKLTFLNRLFFCLSCYALEQFTHTNQLFDELTQ